MVLDHGLVAAGDEDEMLDAGLACFVHHVLNQRPVHHREHFLWHALVAGRKRVPRPATGKMALRMRVMQDLPSLQGP